MKFFKKFIRNNKAATAIEYGLIAALIAVAAISSLGVLSDGLNGIFSKVGTDLSDAADGTGGGAGGGTPPPAAP